MRGYRQTYKGYQNLPLWRDWWTPEYGDGYRYTSFVIPKVCPTITHVDSEDYESKGLVQEHEVFDELIDVAEKDRKIKKNKIKNVFKDED